MNTELALPKVFYELNLKNGKEITIALENEVDWVELMKNPTIVYFDKHSLDTSTIAYAKEIDLSKDIASTAMAYANTLTGAIRAVAIERVRIYESNPSNGKMSVGKILEWLESFQEKWKEWQHDSNLKKYVDIYLKYGGE